MNRSVIFIIYLDNASTTKVKDDMIDTLVETLKKNWHNPSGIYDSSVAAKELLEKYREEILMFLGANMQDQLIFTSSGCESNSLALDMEQFIVLYDPTSHSSILEKCTAFERKRDRYPHCIPLSVDKEGFISIKDLHEKIFEAIGYCMEERRFYFKDQYLNVLISICGGNNVTGTIQDIETIRETIDAIQRQIDENFGSSLERNVPLPKIYFHVDATQLIVHLPDKVNVINKKIDMLTFSGHKLGTPAGIAALYVKRGIELTPLIYGEQEGKVRGGTENLAYIACLAKAIRDLDKDNFEYDQTELVRRLSEIDGFKLIGANIYFRLNNHVAFMIDGVDGESLVQYLNLHGISCATGSACDSHSKEPSKPLLAMGYSPEETFQMVRITSEKRLNYDEVDKVASLIENFVSMNQESGDFIE